MLPLAGRRILITRSRHQASELAIRLQALGATTILLPTIEVVPPLSFAPLDEAISDLSRFDWLVFTSANAVEAFRERCALLGTPPPAWIPTATIGPATARAASAIGLNVTLVPETAVAESLAEALLPRISSGTRILFVRAAVARDHLPEALLAAGAEVTLVDAYRSRVPEESMSSIKELFSDSSRYPDAITFASSSSVVNLLALLQAADLTLPPSIVRASIGPITTQTLCDNGLAPHVQAGGASIASLADSLADYMRKHPSTSPVVKP